MKKIVYSFLILLPLFLFTACGDDDSVEMESYIMGKWRSYKAVVSANNQSVDLDVSKTGQYSVFYYEMTFKNDNTVILGYYEVDKNQMSRWKTETARYSLKDDVVTVFDNEGAMDLFVEGNKLYMRAAGEVPNVGYTTVFVFFCK